jgi:hypothetical protein
MLNKRKTYTISSEVNRTNKFIAAALLGVSLNVLILQARWVLNANAQDNPITSPVSAPQTPQPTASPSLTPSPSGAQSQNQEQNNNQNPITAPEVSPSPSVSPSVQPSASPSVLPSAEPSPSVEPSTSPVPSVSPSAEPSAAPSAMPANNSGENNGNSSSSANGSSSGPSCNNEAPKATRLISAVSTGKNEVTLTWDKALGTVTHYGVAYGVSTNKPMYGASNVGNVTSFKINGLSGGGTYFFKVKAVNDCMPAEYSNEISVKVGGVSISTPAQGFKPGILGKSVKINQTASFSPVPSFSPSTAIQPQQSNSGLLGKIFNFFTGFFKP